MAWATEKQKQPSLVLEFYKKVLEAEFKSSLAIQYFPQVVRDGHGFEEPYV